MSYQEERLQEIADAIREVKGTTEKIPATNFASEIVGLSVVKPSGIKTITENGDYDVKNYAWASVNVEPNLITKEVTENGTYKASDDGADGYSEVVVNVASGGGSGERDVHETLYIMKAIDNMRFEDKQIALREFPTEDEYAEQEIYINTMIKNITGVDFNG